MKAGFAEGGGWAKYKKVLERQHSPTSRASLFACDLVEESGAALPAQMRSVAAATCTSPHAAHVRFSTAHRAKGLGFAHVYLAGDFLGRGQTPADMARERSTEALRDGRWASEAELLQDPAALLGDGLEEEVSPSPHPRLHPRPSLSLSPSLCLSPGPTPQPPALAPAPAPALASVLAPAPAPTPILNHNHNHSHRGLIYSEY